MKRSRRASRAPRYPLRGSPPSRYGVTLLAAGSWKLEAEFGGAPGWRPAGGIARARAATSA
jgi:hypothetical protein